MNEKPISNVEQQQETPGPDAIEATSGNDTTGAPRDPKPSTAATQQRAALPEEVPYVNQYYSYSDRRRDINLMLLLLDEKRDALREELSFVNQCCATRQYPNITGIDDTEG